MKPFLETKRLILKLPELSDLDNLTALRTDPEVMRYIGQGKIQTKAEVKEFLNIEIPYQKKYGFGFASVFEKETNTFIGQAGLFHVELDDANPDIEIAYRLQKKFWGKGYATELTKALIHWGFHHLEVERLVGLFHPENIRSRRVLEKSGMTYTGTVKYNHKEEACYEIYKSDAIQLALFDESWPKMADAEIKKLKEYLPKNHILDIQHVGSTAIPKIKAKPIIDIQIAVDSLIAIKDIAIEVLKNLGYNYWADNPDSSRMFFVKGMPPFGKGRSHHIHIVEPASSHWSEKILFRDYLLSHAEAAQEYETLKIQLAKEHTYDREQYTEAKIDFIKDILQKAKMAYVSPRTPIIIFLTGASGAGKTTLLKALFNTLSTQDTALLHFDSIGVPSETEMIKIYGSGSEWQKAMTYHWVKDLITHYQDKKCVILEGQVNLDFIENAFNGFNVQSYKIILAHCDKKIRHQRLYQGRNQPELINKNMDNWSNFLKKQALGKGAFVLDTTSMSVDEMLSRFKKLIKIKLG